MSSLGSPNPLLFGGAKDYLIERSIRFDGSSSYFRKNDFSGDPDTKKIFTFSAWVKRGNIEDWFPIFGGHSGTSAFNMFGIDSSDRLIWRIRNSSSTDLTRLSSTRKLRDTSNWYHLVLQRDSTQATATNRAKLWVNGEQITDFSNSNTDEEDQNVASDFLTDLHIGRGNINSSTNYYADGYMADVYYIDGQALPPTSFGETDPVTGQWIPKKGDITSPNDGTTWSSSGSDPHSLISSGSIANVFDNDLSTALTANKTTTADNEWVTLCNNVSITAASTVGLYSNGGSSTPTIRINGSTNVAYSGSGSKWTDGSFSGTITKIEFAYLDGSGSSGNVYGVRVDGVQLIDGASKYGTNGAYLNFSDNSDTTAATLGKDSSGNDNNFTPNNFSVAAGGGNDSLEDSPTNNFCTANPLVKPYGTNTYSQGNLYVDGSAHWNRVEGTFAVNSGQWYWEQSPKGTINPSSHILIGVSDQGYIQQNLNAPQNFAAGIWYYDGDGKVRNNGAAYATYGDSYAIDDVIGTALDMDARTVTFYKNGTSQGSLALNANMQLMVPSISFIGSCDIEFNFGQRPFAYSVPADHKTLCAANLPEPTIKDPSKYFNTILYEGNSTDARAITGVGFGPNLVWIKNRDDTDWNNWYDTVRGAGKRISSNSTSVESASTDHMDSIDADGFTLKDGDNTNQNGESYVAWNWKESASAGFDIVSYTGNGSGPRTISHGLGVKPEMIIIKNREQVTNWITYHKAIGAEKFLYLNTNNAQMDDAAAWNDTEPTSSVFTVNADQMNNGDGDDIIAYCFASVEGYSKIGSYIGNANSNGTVIHTGFSPAVVIGKDLAADNWWIFDNKRSPYNLVDDRIFPSLLNVEGAVAADSLDFLANGFKIRGSGNFMNQSGNTFVYIAFARASFKYANAR